MFARDGELSTKYKTACENGRGKKKNTVYYLISMTGGVTKKNVSEIKCSSVTQLPSGRGMSARGAYATTVVRCVCATVTVCIVGDCMCTECDGGRTLDVAHARNGL